MAQQRFLPTTVQGQRDWLDNFSGRLPIYATKYGISTTEQNDLTTGAANLKYWVTYEDTVAQHARKANAYRRELMKGVPAGAVGATLPVLPTFGPAPATASLPDVIGRATSIGVRIKAHKDYVRSDGEDMGLEGAEVHGQPGEIKPMIKAAIGDAGHVHIGWKKGDMDGIEIHKSTDGSPFSFLTIDTKPDYIDTSGMPPPGQSEVWYYRAIYRKNDEQVGQWSDVTSIAVKG